MHRSATLFFILLVINTQAPAQSAGDNRSPLSIETIMQGERFVGHLPEDIRWSEDSRTIYFDWNPGMDTLRSLYRTGVDGGEPQPVPLEVQRQLPGRGDYSRDYRRKVYEQDGDIFLLDIEKGETLRITSTSDRKFGPEFVRNDSALVFTRDNNLYLWELATGATRQLTNLRSGQEKTDPSYRPWEEWLREDQMELFDILRERKAEEEARKRRNEALDSDRPAAYHYSDRGVSDLRVSPDLAFATFRVTRDSKAPGTKVPNYVTESGYLDQLSSRQKVGSPQDEYDFMVHDLRRDTVYRIDPAQIDGIYEKPAFLREYHQDDEPYVDVYDEPRPVLIHGPFFSEDGKAVVVARSLDNKDRWIMRLLPETGTLETLDRQRDEAWIGGPGVSSWNFSAGNIGWLPDNETIWFQSEENGFSHLYTLNVTTGRKRALTSGKYEVLDASLSRDRRHFYLTTNKESPHEQHFYRLPVAGGELQRLTSEPGNHEVTLSPDEKYLAVRYSFSNRPWELYIMENRPEAEMRRITRSTTEAFDAYDWREPEIIRFTAGDGAEVPARLYRPEGAKEGGPAVIFVHGAGYLQNVHRWWSSYYREYMFHNLLVDNGYTVLDIDYRGSAGYGRNWRTAIYRHMGGKDLSDQVDGARYLAEELGVDPERIGIYGGSYGGFITLMALFNSPGAFQCGAALRSVTDWAHYNHPYTSNILNTPVEDSLAYARSSPIYFADGLEDHLLILHGMIDQNVQFQDVVRLAQRLVELGKDDWEFAVFPLERHGFVEPSSWADEYKRIFKLFQERLR